MTDPQPISRLNAALQGRYHIERELGEGGMATVYLARDERHNRRVALKVLKPALAAALGHERFLKEIEVTANLNHPHILPLHDSGEASGFLYYVMPYVEGESLRDRLDRDRELPVDESLRIAKAVATALDYAHRQGIVHRDIKPRNILLQDGQPLIADFGIALAVTAAAGDRLTATGLSIGTPQYMSPEQAAADRPVDGRTDVYALACILFEMLAGEPPFTAGNVAALLARKLTDTAPDVATVRESVPPHVADAVRRALSRTPADRFGSAADFARALGESDPAIQPGSPRVATGVTRPTVSPARWRLALVALVVGALGGVLVGTLLRSAPATPHMTFAVPLSGRDVATGNWRPLGISPDGSQLAILLEDSTDRRLYLKAMDGAPVAVEGSEGAMSPTFSPDGRSLAYFTRDGIWRLNLETGSKVRIADSYQNIMGATWTDDDRLVFSPGYRGGLWVVPASGGGRVSELTRLEAGESTHRYPSAVRGTPLVLLRVGGDPPAETGIWLLDTDTGERMPLIADDGAENPSYADGMLFFVRDETLFGQRLDADRRALIGETVPIHQDVVGLRYAISETGTLVYVRNHGWPTMRYLARIDASGGQSLITSEAAPFRTPRVSPDGERVAVSIGSEMRIYDLGTGAMEVVEDSGRPIRPVWSPDGSALVYTIQADSTGGVIVRRSSSTGERVELAVGEGSGAFDNPASLTWDGDDLIVWAMGVTSGTEGDLWRVRSDGGREPLRVDRAIALSADISREGRYAYTEGAMGEDMQLWLAASTVVRASIPVPGFGVSGVRWAPDGRSIYFIDRSELVRLPVDATGNPMLSARTTVFDFGQRPSFISPPFDVHPDGEHLVVTIPVPTLPTEVLVETGWLDSVRDQIQ